MPKSRKCAVCAVRVPKNKSYIVDLDTGDIYHKTCFREENGVIPKNIKMISEDVLESTIETHNVQGDMPLPNPMVEPNVREGMVACEVCGKEDYERSIQEYNGRFLCHACRGYNTDEELDEELETPPTENCGIECQENTLLEPYTAEELGLQHRAENAIDTKALTDMGIKVTKGVVDFLKTPEGQKLAKDALQKGTTVLQSLLSSKAASNPTMQQMEAGISDEIEGADKYKQWASEFEAMGEADKAELMRQFSTDELGHKAALKQIAREMKGRVLNPSEVDSGELSQGEENLTDEERLHVQRFAGAVAKGRENPNQYRVKYWVDEEHREQGESDSEGRYDTKDEAINVAKNLYRRMGYPAVEVELNNMPIYHISDDAPDGEIVENPNVIAAKFGNMDSPKQHGDILILENNVIYRWDTKMDAWTPEDKFLQKNKEFSPSPVRSQKTIPILKSSVVEENVYTAEENPRLSQKLLPHVRKLIQSKKKGDWAGAQRAERKINDIAGDKVIPHGLTAEEMDDPMLLAKRISCISQLMPVAYRQGYNPYAIARSKVVSGKARKNPEENLINRESYLRKLIDHLEVSMVQYQYGDKERAAKHYFEAYGMWGGLSNNEKALMGKRHPVGFDWINLGWQKFGGDENPITRTVA